MKNAILSASALALVLTAAGGAGAQSRDQIRIVGSSTVYPFTTAVAEQFGRQGGMRAPVVESTGTGGGLKLFCAGVGTGHPDAANASRRINKAEFEDCRKNGVTDIVELKVGFDGIVLAGAKNGPDLRLTKEQVFRALAKQVPGPDGKLVPNTARNWSDIDRSLPNTKIEVLGPPPTSGTRDSFVELVMESGAQAIPAMAEMRRADRPAFDSAFKAIREDGAYVEAGENDNLIVQKLGGNPNALGIFGYSFLDENAGRIKGATVDGQAPTYETISSGQYKVARPLFVYVKKQHVGVVPGLDRFVAEYVSEKAIGEDGYLSRKGLVTLPKEELARVRAEVAGMKTLGPDAAL